MDLVRLDPYWYQPDDLVEGYSSLIWTERYLNAGEFQLDTYDIGTKDLIPEGTAVSLLDSKKVMLVESHNITEDDDGVDVLKTTGRAFETILEARVAARNLNALPQKWAIKQKTTGQIVSAIIQEAIGAYTSIARTTSTNHDHIPWLEYSSAVPADDKDDYVVELTDVYSQVIKLLQAAGFGIRVHRLANEPLAPGLKLQIYKGADRSSSQSTNKKVVFSYDAGHIKSPSYFFTNKDYRNIAYVYSKLGSRIVSAPGVSLNVSGLDRRVLPVVAEDIEQDDPPYTASELDGILKRRGRLALAQHNKRFMFDCEWSPLAPYKYNKDYFLGDKVTIKAKYGVNRNVVISEYIRIQDENGEREYPTLIPDS